LFRQFHKINPAFKNSHDLLKLPLEDSNLKILKAHFRAEAMTAFPTGSNFPRKKQKNANFRRLK